MAGLSILAAAGLVWWAMRPDPADARLEISREPVPDDFVGARACRECHPGEHAAHGGSGHARTLRPAATIALTKWLDGRHEADPEQPAVRWDYAVEEGRLGVTRVEAEDSRRFEFDYALGSGKHAITFMSWDGDGPGPRGGLEHRLTYFAHANAMRVTPGQEAPNSEPGLSPEGFHVPPNVMRDCLSCHATRTSAAGPRVVDPKTLIPNVSCERCHGPGRSHVEAARRSAPPSELVMAFAGRGDAASEVRMCGRCHRLPEMVPPDSIRPDSAMLARFPSVGLMQSECFVKSKGTMRCTTCHDPHARTATEAAPYEKACLSCHDQASRKLCSVNPRDGCVGCHMPKRDVGHGLMFTDHWVRKDAAK